jgi:hypothetical protein
MISRRGLLEAAGGALALTGAGSVPAWSSGAGEKPDEALLSRAGGNVLDVLPGKKPLIKLPAFGVVAVCPCSGNRRGLVQPHVAGV